MPRVKKSSKKLQPAERQQPNAQTDPFILKAAAFIPAIARIAVFCLSLIYLCPIKVFPIVPGLDPSWAYALNDAHAKGLVWGRDLGFTYGPWAYLSIGMNVGRNLDNALAVQLAAWILGVPILWYLLIKRSPSWLGCLMFFGSLGFSYTALHRFGYVGLDHFSGLMVIWLLAAAMYARRWQIPYGAAIAVAAFAAMIKFSAGVFSLSAIILYALVALLYDRKKAAIALLITSILFPVTLAIFYLSHNASFESLLCFIRTSMERSDSYNISNSLPSSPNDLMAALVLFSAYALFSAVLFICRDKAAYFSIVLLAPWFFVFKHGFVRSDSHVGIFFSMGGVFFGTLLLLTDFQKKHWWKYAAPLPVLLLAGFLTPALQPIIQWHTPFTEIRRQFVTNTNALWPGFKNTLNEISAGALATDRLPADLLAAIADKSIAVFPWELAYGAANPINLKPMPMLQSYGADSAWLDRWNARIFTEPKQRPEFLLLEWQAIDGRHALLDTPATALEIFRWYGVEKRSGDRLLTRGKDSPRFAATRSLKNFESKVGELIEVPVSLHPVAGSLRMNLSLYGKLVKFLWKIPEVNLTLLSGDGRSWVYRIIPDVLSNLGLIGPLPFNLDELENLLGKGQIDHAVKYLLVSGPGAKYYQPRIEGEFLELPGVTLTETQSETAKYDKLPLAQSIDSWRIDMINDQDASVGGSVTLPPTAKFVRMTGWAVDPVSSDCAAAVAVEVDGKSNAQAVYGLPRPEVPLLLKTQKCMTSGYEWSLPLPTGHHHLRLKILASGRGAWYPADKSVDIIVPSSREL